MTSIAQVGPHASNAPAVVQSIGGARALLLAVAAFLAGLIVGVGAFMAVGSRGGESACSAFSHLAPAFAEDTTGAVRQSVRLDAILYQADGAVQRRGALADLFDACVREAS